MPRKANIFNRISRIFNTKDVTHHNNNLQSVQPPPIPAITTTSTIHDTSSFPILLQRAPSSKLLIDDFDISTLEYSYSYSDIHNTVTKQQQPQQENNRQSWFSTISKLKTLKRHNKKSKRKSIECWFVAQQQGGTVKIPDQQQQQQGVEEEQDKKVIMSSPLSATSSLFSSAKEAGGEHHHFSSSSSSSWIPVDGNTSTARTSIDSQHQNLAVVQQEKKNGSCISLAENVKNILGDAIYLADQELEL